MEVFICDIAEAMFVHEFRGAVFVTWVAREHVEHAARFPAGRDEEFVKLVEKLTGVVCVAVPAVPVSGVGKWNNHTKPPFGEWVEVGNSVADSECGVAKAVLGTATSPPHWLRLDGTTAGPSRYNTWRRNESLCPTTGHVNCNMCSSEYCAVHLFGPCDCDVVQRHKNHTDYLL